MSVRPRLRNGETIGWIGDVRVNGRRMQRLFKTREDAERFANMPRARRSEVRDVVLDWFELPLTFRTKKKLLEMLS